MVVVVAAPCGLQDPLTQRIMEVYPPRTPPPRNLKHLEGAGNRKPQIVAGKPKIFAETAGNRRLVSVTLGPSPLSWPYNCSP